MENNNGRGIFYGVIGVATLVVAIIGATFAYFSASAANNNAIKVGSTEIKLALQGEEYNYYTTMIPVDADNEYFSAYPGLTTMLADKSNKGKGTCTDDLGNAICGVYQFTIANDDPAVTQTVYGSLTVKNTTFPAIDNGTLTNVHYAVFKGTAAKVAGTTDKFKVTGTGGKVTEVADGGLVIPKTALGLKDTTQDKSNSDWDNLTQTLQPKGTSGSSQTYTIVVWLEENGAKNAGDQGKLFQAAIKFDTGSTSGVTGTLTAVSG